MGWRQYMGALALSHLLAATNVASGSPAAADQQESLAERIDLTRITVLQADYARAAKERNTRDLAAYDRELAAMLRDDVLPYASGASAPPGARKGGTGGGSAAPGGDTAGAPAVAVDEEAVGAAALEAKVVDLSREFLSLAGKTDDASLTAKSSIIGSLQAISERAQFPGSSSDTERSRDVRQQVGQERRERERIENLPQR